MANELAKPAPNPSLTAFANFLGIHRWTARALAARFRFAGLEQRAIRLPHGQLRVWVGGQGPPLLLLHGFGADATLGWHPQVHTLARKHTLIVPDLLWFGESHSDEADFSLHHQAHCMAALCAALGHERYDVCGISYGGLVAFTMTATFQDRVRRLILVDSPGPVYSDADHQHILDVFGVTEVADIVIPEHPDDIVRLLQLAWYRPPPAPRIVLYDTYEQLFRKRTDEKRALLRWLDTLRNGPEGIPEWDVPQPVLLIWGEHDPLFPVALGQRLEAALPDARLLVIPETRHAPNLEQPKVFNQAIRTFLR